ncbi:related to domain [Lecanosticta acicola]|uniref:Related to domain n=1 Tax=Lecanosticta acicola TaxID=111012 RepID=A0AAI8Z4I2_9PEZI|nr:related to domain [Lecanosticta acicola]
MPSMRIRTPFAASFGVLLFASAYLGLTTEKIPSYGQSDKGLHFVSFFLLTLTFYWILETSRRRVIHLTLLFCTAGLAIGSEVAQALLPNGRDFDPFDILANVVGSTCALLLSSWYHKRMLERRRKNKHYDIVAGDEEGEVDPERDVELGEGVGLGNQETGSVPADTNGQASAGAKSTNVTEELDNWDENDEDWEEEGAEAAKVVAGVSGEEEADSKKRTD